MFLRARRTFPTTKFPFFHQLSCGDDRSLRTSWTVTGSRRHHRPTLLQDERRQTRLERFETIRRSTTATAQFLRENGKQVTELYWPLEQFSPNALEYLSQRKIDLVLNIPKNYQEEELTNDYLIRRRAADFGIPLLTDIQLAHRFVEAIACKRIEDLEVKSYRGYDAERLLMVMHQRLQGSPIGPLPLSLMGRRRV